MRQLPPALPGHCNSWIIVRRDTGKPLVETYSAAVAAEYDPRYFEVLLALVWLQRYARLVTAAGGAVAKVKKLVSAVLRTDGYMFFGFVKDDDSLGIVAGCQNRTLPSYRAHVKTDYLERSNSAAVIDETTTILDFLEKRHAAMTK